MQSTCQFTIRAHQEMRYQNVTWHNHLICLLTYAYRNHWTINTTTHPLPEHSSNAYLLRVVDVGLRKAPFVSLRLLSTFRVSDINYFHLVCSLPIHKMCALCGICAIDDWKLRWPWNPGFGWVKVIKSYTSEFLTLSCEVVEKVVFGPPICSGPGYPDFEHAFSNHTYFRACGRFWLGG